MMWQATQSLRRKIRSAAHRRGWDIVKLRPSFGKDVPVLDFIIGDLVRRNITGPIVQVGANDGVMDDPIQTLIRRFDLPALLIEPRPDVFNRLSKNYADKPNVHCVNCAIHPKAQSIKLWRVDPKIADLPETPDFVSGLASFNREGVINYLPDELDESCLVQVEVPCSRLKPLVEQHLSAKPLMLQVDTEGFDAEVIKLAAEENCLYPLVRYEIKHLSYADQRDCRKLLEDRGYCFLDEQFDLTAVHASLIESP